MAGHVPEGEEKEDKARQDKCHGQKKCAPRRMLLLFLVLHSAACSALGALSTLHGADTPPAMCVMPAQSQRHGVNSQPACTSHLKAFYCPVILCTWSGCDMVFGRSGWSKKDPLPLFFLSPFLLSSLVGFYDIRLPRLLQRRGLFFSVPVDPPLPDPCLSGVLSSRSRCTNRWGRLSTNWWSPKAGTPRPL